MSRHIECVRYSTRYLYKDTVACSNINDLHNNIHNIICKWAPAMIITVAHYHRYLVIHYLYTISEGTSRAKGLLCFYSLWVLLQNLPRNSILVSARTVLPVVQ